MSIYSKKVALAKAKNTLLGCVKESTEINSFFFGYLQLLMCMDECTNLLDYQYQQQMIVLIANGWKYW